MISFNNFIYSPGGENEGGNDTSNSNENQNDGSDQIPESKEEGKKDKSIIQKIREALKDWSNKNEEDQEYDDTKV